MYGRRVRVDPPELADIGHQYDFSSIFANPAQENMFTDPYKPYNNTTGDLFNYEGSIDDLSTGTPYADYSQATDKLLNILREERNGRARQTKKELTQVKSGTILNLKNLYQTDGELD